ncbi:MAG TPA: hypothetical protein VMB34_23445, partial [Acetobacteraceae bacterium]|nr:hypothetical protein [Acetobacteraceae bacterium]
GTTAVAWTAGVKYTMPFIPATIGAYYFNYKYQGTVTAPFLTQRVSQGIDVGAVYGMGPGVSLVAEYAWGQNSQGDFDFLTNTAGLNNNTVQAQVATVGMSIRF